MTGARQTRTAVFTALVLATFIVASASCTSTPEPTVPTLDDTTARHKVLQLADEVLTLAGWSGYSITPDLKPQQCNKPNGEITHDTYTIVGTFQLLVPQDQQPDLIARVTAGWTAKGYAIRATATHPDGGGLTTATADDFVDMTLASGEPPAMTLIMATACYRH